MSNNNPFHNLPPPGALAPDYGISIDDIVVEQPMAYVAKSLVSWHIPPEPPRKTRWELIADELE